MTAKLGRVVAVLAALGSLAANAAASGEPVASDCDEPAHLRVLHAATELPAAWRHAQGIWLDDRLIRWPQVSAAPGTRFRLAHAATGTLVLDPGAPVRGADRMLTLQVSAQPVPAAVAQRFPHVRGGTLLRLSPAQRVALPGLLRGQLMLVHEDRQGRVLQASALQHAGALDALYAAADSAGLGAKVGRAGSRFALWAPTAQRVGLCLYAGPEGPAIELRPLRRNTTTGVWAGDSAKDLSASSYTYLVDLFTPGLGLVRHRVTDPYALALSADSKRSVAVDLDAATLKPRGWDHAARPRRALTMTDLVVYELHLRDFSVGDVTVAEAHRGKYLAFTHAGSNGMRHLRALAEAGVTDLHLLPVFDIASVPERGCTSADAAELARHGPASEAQQAAVMAQAANDCFNWGYDPLHYTVPEGSYATDATDPARRIVEFRQMVMALHASGLRVGMDVVYNHTHAAGHDARSVLDRIVPGYYHRLDAEGRIERSTCCDNTATEHRMMARLMIDSAVTWVRAYRIDSLRFDLMGHQPRTAMLRLQRAVNRAAGRRIHLIGEGWNFGEVKDGARFVQAAQGRLDGTGIATFSDRGRDAVRGGGCCDSGADVLTRQGWINGLAYDRNAAAMAAGTGTAAELRARADLVRAALAGSLREYRLPGADGRLRRLAELDYAGQPAGYAGAPGEVVNYVENHDNATLFDINALKLPRGTSAADRARVQVLGLAVVAFAQGVAYFHAGGEVLRSKSLDRNSFDSGDWFNRLDWTFADNYFGAGLPPKAENGAMWPLIKPVLEDESIRPGATEIRFARDAFLDLLRIRASSGLFRLRRAGDVHKRLHFHATGTDQAATTIVGQLDGRGLAGANFAELLFAINVSPRAAQLDLPGLAGRAYLLHPVHRAAAAADARPAREARWDAGSGRLTVPPRTALVYVLD